MCRPYYGENDTDEENAIDLMSLAPRTLANVQGVIIDKIIDGLNVDNKESVKKLKYDEPDMRGHDISQCLFYNELDLIVGDPEEIDYDNLTKDEKTKCNKYIEAWYTKLDEL